MADFDEGNFELKGLHLYDTGFGEVEFTIDAPKTTPVELDVPIEFVSDDGDRTELGRITGTYYRTIRANRDLDVDVVSEYSWSFTIDVDSNGYVEVMGKRKRVDWNDDETGPDPVPEPDPERQPVSVSGDAGDAREVVVDGAYADGRSEYRVIFSDGVSGGYGLQDSDIAGAYVGDTQVEGAVGTGTDVWYGYGVVRVEHVSGPQFSAYVKPKGRGKTVVKPGMSVEWSDPSR